MELRITEIIDVAKIAEPLFVIALNAIVTDLCVGNRCIVEVKIPSGCRTHFEERCNDKPQRASVAHD